MTMQQHQCVQEKSIGRIESDITHLRENCQKQEKLISEVNQGATNSKEKIVELGVLVTQQSAQLNNLAESMYIQNDLMHAIESMAKEIKEIRAGIAATTDAAKHISDKVNTLEKWRTALVLTGTGIVVGVLLIWKALIDGGDVHNGINSIKDGAEPKVSTVSHTRR